MDEIFDYIKSTKIKRKYLISSLILTELLGILVLVWFLRVPLTQKFLVSPPKSYSVVTLNDQKRYLISSGDFLTGRGIPNTKVKILITPGNIKSSVSVNSTGNWSYQIPQGLLRKIYRLSFGNFDKNNKLAVFRSFKFRIKSNISLFNFFDSIGKGLSSFSSLKTAKAQFNPPTYTDSYALSGLPDPTNPERLSADTKFRLINYFLPYVYPASKIVGADWKPMAMYVLTEDGITNYMDNCLDYNPSFGPDADGNANTSCTGWGWPNISNWQVGWAIFPWQMVDKLPEAIAVMKPGKTIQQIGQEVILDSYDQTRYSPDVLSLTKTGDYWISNPEIFPGNVTLGEIVNGAKPILEKPTRQKPTEEEKRLVLGTKTCRPFVDKNTDPSQDPKDCKMRQLAGILMKDPAVSAYLLALMWKEIQDQGSIRQGLIDLGGEYAKLNLVSNRVAGIENAVAGIDLEAIAKTPVIIVPSAGNDPAYPAEIRVDPIVAEDGREAYIPGRTQVVILPSNLSPKDLEQPTAENNVRGINNIDSAVMIRPEGGEDCNEGCTVTLDETTLSNYENYQLCAILTPLDYDIIISSDCMPLSQIINPQIPVDTYSQTEPDQADVTEPDPSELIIEPQEEDGEAPAFGPVEPDVQPEQLMPEIDLSE